MGIIFISSICVCATEVCASFTLYCENIPNASGYTYKNGVSVSSCNFGSPDLLKKKTFMVHLATRKSQKHT